jgi:heat-inducible transcriptional repressor
VRQLSSQDKRRIEQQYRLKGLRLEERLREAGKVLSAISHYAGVVMAPRIISTVFRHIEFVKLSHGRILVVLVTQNGIVQNRIIESNQSLSQSELEQMSNYLNRTLTGLSIPEVKARILQEMAKEKALYNELLQNALILSTEAFREDSGGEIFIEGASNILEQPEFADLQRMKRLFRAFEQKGVLIELLDKSQQAGGVQIFIGSEHQYSEIEGCSLITATYSSRGTLGTLGVIGPSRMPYSLVIPIVDYTARLVSRILEVDSE